jgi:hypothetical protein
MDDRFIIFMMIFNVAFDGVWVLVDTIFKFNVLLVNLNRLQFIQKSQAILEYSPQKSSLKNSKQKENLNIECKY